MNTDNPQVSILLATLNGARFLKPQLRSLLQQEHRNWNLILSDDGSYDDTLAIAKKLIPPKQLMLLEGPGTGLTQNFWNALKRVPNGDYVAFCDQDDVWRRCKLTRALKLLSDQREPAVYASGRIVTDDDLEIRCYQKRRSVGAFARLLLRNQVAGHTCVLNPSAVRELKRFAPPPSVPFHDWWAALVLKGIGARFIHDPTPTLFYRQHKSNRIGAHGGRLQTVLDGTYSTWLQSNYNALWPLREHFTSSARHALGVCLPLRAGLSLTEQ